MIGIYKITSPSGKVYVGQSIDIDKRFMGYKNPKQTTFENQTRLKRSMLKYGWANHAFEVLCECSAEDLNMLERKYQDEFDVIGLKGLNCLLTEVDGKPRVWSDESRKKMGRKGEAHHMYGKAHSAESLAKISASKKGKPSPKKGIPLAEETKAKLRVSRKGVTAGEKHHMYGKKHKQESCKKISETKLNRTPEEKAATSALMSAAAIGRIPSNAKKIIRLADGTEYSSVKKAAEANGILPGTLRSKLRGRGKNDTGLALSATLA